MPDRSPPALPLWPHVAASPIPRLHVLSDLHLEFGPYELAPDLEFDILVAAGDIGRPEDAVKWLAATRKPAVYVMGNHEYYGREFGEVVAAARHAAKGTRVRVLERNAVIIQGVRFLGTTLWTSFGGWHPGLVLQAHHQMSDYSQIRATAWYAAAGNLEWMRRRCAEARLPPPAAAATQDGVLPFHPAIAYREHLRSVAWLRRQLDRRFGGPTVVVTHHAPTYRSLEAFGVGPDALQPANWNANLPSETLRRVAAYASPLDRLLAENRDCIDLWVHGHLHAGLDVIAQGVRVLANPRGYPTGRRAVIGPLLAKLGIGPGTGSRDGSPYPGNAPDFDWRMVVDLEKGLERPLLHAIVEPIATMRRCVEEAEKLLPHLREDESVRTACVQESFSRRMTLFGEALAAVLWEVANGLDAGTDALPLSVLSPPQTPWPAASPDGPETTTREDARARLTQMRLWTDWAETLPDAATVALRQWGQATVRLLEIARGCQVRAVCTRQPVASLRSLTYSRLHSLYVEATPEALRVFGDKVSEAFRDERPRRSVRLQPMSRAPDRTALLVTLATLRPGG